LIGLAPDIDWKTTIDFNKITNRLLQVNTKVNGKGFPAYESFIEDAGGTRVFLQTIAAPNKLQLRKELLSPLYDALSNNKLRFETDIKGNFTGKMYTCTIQYTPSLNKRGKTEFTAVEIWNETTIEEYNKSNKEKPAAPDLITN
jgi:hypothetical protein